MAEELLGFETVELRGQLVDVLRQRSDQRVCTEDFNLVDCLPEGLEYLCIRGYERGRNPDVDAQVDRLLAAKETGVLNLKEVEGVEKCIPNAEHVEGPNNRDKLWRLEENWTGKW